MKGRSIVGLVVCLAVLGIGLIPAQAQKQNQNVEDLPYFRQLKQINRTQAISPEISPDPRLERAIIRENPDYPRVANTFSQYPRYFYNKVDLNGDNRPEVLVHLTGPFFCGSGGCTTLIFQSVGQNYRLVSEISVSTDPVIVTNQKNFGWNDLIIVGAGGSWGSNQGYYLLRFNGRSYPNNPGNGIKLRPNSIMTGRAFFSNLDYNNGGIALQPQNSQIAAGQSSSSGQQTAVGRSQSSTPSLMRAANFQSVHGVTVEPAKEPTRDLAKLQRNYSFILDRINSRDLQDGTTVYSFDVYNTGYADGVIEVRNARGDLVEVRAIEGVRNPTNPIGFGIYSIKKEWESLTDFMNGRWFNDPRFATAQQKKTTIENIAIPPRGSLTFTKTGANAQAYNQATLIMGFFFGGWLSESEENPASLPGALNRILGEDATFKQKFFAALFLKLQEKRIGNLVKEGAFQDLSSTLQAFTTGSWIEEENFSELVKTGIDVFFEEGIKYGITDRVLKEKLFGASLKTWVTAAEIFAKGGNVFLQNLDLERAKIAEQNNGSLAIIEPR